MEGDIKKYIWRRNRKNYPGWGYRFIDHFPAFPPQRCLPDLSHKRRQRMLANSCQRKQRKQHCGNDPHSRRMHWQAAHWAIAVRPAHGLHFLVFTGALRCQNPSGLKPRRRHQRKTSKPRYLHGGISRRDGCRNCDGFLLCPMGFGCPMLMHARH